MEKITIYRCLPFEEWHKPFESTGGPWYVGGIRHECDCPYGSHRDVRFLDYKDPLNLMEILFLKKGTKLLTLYSWKGTEHVAFHTFREFEFLSDFMRLMFEEKVSVYGYNEEQFTPIRFIAVIENAETVTAFGKRGGINVFIKELSKLTGISVQEVRQQINELEQTPIPSGLKLSTNEITISVEEAGTYVMHM